jgi:hypothetical protein
MKTIRLIAVGSLAAAIFACSSSPPGGFGTEGPEQDSGAPGTSSGEVGSSGSSGGSTSSSGGNGASSGGANGNGGSDAGASSGNNSGDGGLSMSDAAPGDNPDIDYSVAPVTLTMTPFTVAPGGEVFYCQTFANPWGKQVDVKTYSLDMGVGSHHMFAFYATNATDVALAPCANGGLTFGPYTFSAQQPTLTTTYPQSVGATIPNQTGFQLMVHYLNTTSASIQSSVNLTMWIAKPSVVTNHAGALFLNNATMTVASDCTQGCNSTDSYTLMQDVNLLSADSHMHKYATNFVATTSTGVTLFSTTQWAEPPAKVFSPALALTAGTSITWTCTDVNATGQELTFGESAVTNVMCIYTSIFYPVSDVTNPVLGSLVGFAGL